MFSDLLQQLLLALLPNEPVYYIGGSEVLPPPLSREAEDAALTALCAGNKSAERTLIEHNLRLVVYIARRFENTGVGLEDLISIGTIGLIKAVSTFDREKNIKLATYASRCIENEILMYLRKISAQRTEVSFDEPLNTDWDGNELLLSDVLGTDEDEVSRPMEDDADRRALHEAVAKLSERDRDIISLRFGLLGRREYTQKEVADRMGISQSYISRLEKRILLRLRRETHAGGERFSHFFFCFSLARLSLMIFMCSSVTSSTPFSFAQSTQPLSTSGRNTRGTFRMVLSASSVNLTLSSARSAA